MRRSSRQASPTPRAAPWMPVWCWTAHPISHLTGAAASALLTCAAAIRSKRGGNKAREVRNIRWQKMALRAANGLLDGVTACWCAGGGLVGLCAVGQQPGVRRCRQCAGRAVGLQAPAAGGQQPLLRPAAGHQPRCLRVADAGRHGHRLPGGARARAISPI